MRNEASLGWAIAGTGGIARRFAADMRLSKCGAIKAVASGDPERARGLAAAIGPGIGHGDLDAVLARADVGAVYVAGRNEDHARVAIRCLEAGKPVLVEKPFATSEAEARLVAEAASRAGLLASEAMWMRFTPGIRRLKAIVEGGGVGEVRAIDAALFFRNEAPSAGVLLDLGVYPVSLALHLLGRPAGIVASASGAGDAVALSLGYPRAVASLSCGFSADGANRLTITGERGRLASDDPFLCPSLLTLHGTPVDTGKRHGGAPDEPLPPPARLPWLASAKALLRPLRPRRIPTIFAGSGLHYQADHFAECLALGLTDSPVMPLADSIETLRIVEAAQAMLSR